MKSTPITTGKYEGPIAVRPDQFVAVAALANRVFRPNGGDMAREFPLVLDRTDLEKMRIISKDGQPVSLVCLVVKDAVLQGFSTRVALLGGVCTDQAARGLGLAGKLVDDAVDRACSQEATVLLISGNRSLYTRRGAVPAGVYHRYTISAAQLPTEETGLSVEEVLPDDCKEALNLYRSEPIRFRRTEQEYAAQIACGWTMNNPGKTYIVRRAIEPLAVVSVNRPRTAQPNDTQILGVHEMAGSRQAVLAVLGRIAKRLGAEAVVIDAYCFDYAFKDACSLRGISPQTIAHRAAVKILSPQRLLEDAAGFLGERIGTETAARIRVHCQADDLKIHTLAFQLDNQELTFHGAQELTAVLFGATDIDSFANESSPLAKTLQKAIPLPLPLYGLDFV